MFVKKKNKTSYNMAENRMRSIEGKSRSLNTYADYVIDFVEGGTSHGEETFITAYTDEEIKEMLANPEDNIAEISDLLYYNYISGGVVYQLYTAYKALPSMKYEIGVHDTELREKEHIVKINKKLRKVKYKELSRDITVQSGVDGGVVCMWCGNEDNLFLHIFDNNTYVFPKYRLNGEWVCVVDLSRLEDMEEEERTILFTNLAPYVTESMYTSYQGDTSDKTKQYVELPVERTSYIRSGDYLRRNQRMSIPLGTQSLLDLNHKEQLKNLEKSVANRAIKNIAILQIGSNESGKSFIDIGKTARNQIVNGVGRALKQNATTDSTQVPVATIPEFCKLDFTKIDGLEALGEGKYSNVDNDLAKDSGISDGLAYGVGSNNTGISFNLDFLYKRIALVLEQIDHLFDKMIVLLLGEGIGDNYYFELDKEQPLNKAERAEILFKLQSQGWSTDMLLRQIGIDFDNMVEATKYELETLEVRKWLVPPMSSYTMSGNVSGNSDTEETTIDKDIEGGESNE